MTTQRAKAAHDLAGDNPIAIFEAWYALAQIHEPNLPDAVSLATVDRDGQPNARMVLLKGFDDRGFVFYTNLDSQKGHELREVPKAALCFHWKSIKKQIRIQGVTEQVSDEEADAYFATRAKDSQIGAWASKQSHILEGRFELEKRVAKYAAKYAVKKIDRPDFWSGFRVIPTRIEFWQEQSFRLHDRFVFTRRDPNAADWIKDRLYP